MCKIGSPIIKNHESQGLVAMATDPLHSPQGNAPSSIAAESRTISRLSGVFSKLPLTAIKGMVSKGQSSTVLSLPLGQQDEHFGVPVSLVGQLASACILQEPLLDNSVRALFTQGRAALLYTMLVSGKVQTQLSFRLVIHIIHVGGFIISPPQDSHNVSLDLQ